MALPLCDLVLLSWNHLEQTQPCLDSLFATTDVPTRLFIVDNGSEPSVREALRAVRPRGRVQEVALLQNETNEGFPRGMNRGIRASSAPYVCLLNNDLLFTSGWLSRLIAVAQATPDLGVLNPASNTFGQRPPRGESLEAYAATLAARGTRHVEVGMCIGFCMLITRPVLERIGGLSEEVERIFFEDEDFCMRAAAAGFRSAVAEASYVHHAEHQTVRKMPEREALFSRNQAWCHEKWGAWLRVAYPRIEVPALEVHCAPDDARAKRLRDAHGVISALIVHHQHLGRPRDAAQAVGDAPGFVLRQDNDGERGRPCHTCSNWLRSSIVTTDAPWIRPRPRISAAHRRSGAMIVRNFFFCRSRIHSIAAGPVSARGWTVVSSQRNTRRSKSFTCALGYQPPWRTQ